MDVKIQFTDGSIVTVDHSQFANTIRNRDIFRFSIGTVDFYNHDFYAVEPKADHILISMWDDPINYPPEQSPHACVFKVYSPIKWERFQYGSGADPTSTIPFDKFIAPKNNLKIIGKLIPDQDAETLKTDWPITRLSDYSKEGM